MLFKPQRLSFRNIRNLQEQIHQLGQDIRIQPQVASLQRGLKLKRPYSQQIRILQNERFLHNPRRIQDNPIQLKKLAPCPQKIIIKDPRE